MNCFRQRSETLSTRVPQSVSVVTYIHELSASRFKSAQSGVGLSQQHALPQLHFGLQLLQFCVLVFLLQLQVIMFPKLLYDTARDFNCVHSARCKGLAVIDDFNIKIVQT